jgi:hypothetical protein
LKKELPRLRVSVRVLNSEFLLAELEAEPMEAVRVTDRPLNREPERPRESAKILKKEFLFASPDDAPREVLSAFASPLT